MPMKLYITPGSAYARMARVVLIEKGLDARVEVVLAQTRRADSPYYAICPSGRVPYLVRDDGVGMEESAVICGYLDQLDDAPTLTVPPETDRWEWLRLEASARSLLDGLSVWLRETSRPTAEQSPGVVRHEMARSERMLDVWEEQTRHPLMREPLNILQITLACALGLEARMPGLLWRAGRPRLVHWYDRVGSRASFISTAPPAAR
jgi:glutathione S-transferase